MMHPSQDPATTLNKILEMELAGVVRYTHYSLMVFGYTRIPIVSWLRSQATALLFSGISGADRLQASVVASRQGTVLKTYAVGAASALGGRVWSDPTERLRRLARLLGQQIALGL